MGCSIDKGAVTFDLFCMLSTYVKGLKFLKSFFLMVKLSIDLFDFSLRFIKITFSLRGDAAGRRVELLSSDFSRKRTA